ncbi:hypothetical protein M595_5780 [Lyngbya aestuarii BL J]|mgnify:CR=1 FL=1|uniref:Uncharacterized protein n=1 Tax=Lyngbya aestuarii BL J TaxID=1348334 RepID=U7Q920_9CYAN|nr:hypothetical protein [Lyngbya aestuarii]ERT04283.1 hypothetical protein M595_5780 [Lyngbya aestuarii BL J]
MFEVSPDHGAIAAALLTHYSFDLGDYSSEERVEGWGENYEYYWIYFAVIEALYQGRYKSISVEQILSIWLRRGKPIYHFNWEFEQLICKNLPKALTVGEEVGEASNIEETDPDTTLEQSSPVENLKPRESSTRPPLSLTKPPRTTTSIHTDFMVKLKMILENSQKTLPPARSSPDSEP